MNTLLILLSTFFVSFTNKAGSSPIPFTERAIEQRARWNITTDSLDYAVSPDYLARLQKIGVSICHTSRWLNGATIKTDELTAQQVAQLPFVKSIEMTREDDSHTPSTIALKKHAPIYSPESIGTHTAQDQLNIMNLPPLHKAGYEGQGILMAICDVGFQNYPDLTCFDHSHHLGTFDLTDDSNDIYGDTGQHGTSCLSTIAAVQDDLYGSAIQADYYLMRSEEMATESPKEADNMIVAMEKADSLGVNIFSASLGYYAFDNTDWNYPYEIFDGKTTRATIAATIAARKGMLLCISAGNEGSNQWGYITIPNDADSILTIGAVDMYGLVAPFSSKGPTADGRTKPDVCGMGVKAFAILPYDQSIAQLNGTSFACPLIAGMAASLWSALPEENAMQIRERIIRSAHRNDRPDNTFGYGIPDAWAAYGKTSIEENTISSTQARKVLIDNNIYILIDNKRYNLLGMQE